MKNLLEPSKLVSSNLGYTTENWRGYKPRQQIYRFIEILTENVELFNAFRLGNWHLMPSQLGLAILQGAQNCNRQDFLWHFEAHAVSYC